MEKIHVMKKLFRKAIFFLKKTNYKVKSDGHAILTYFSSRSKHWSCKSWNPNSFFTRTCLWRKEWSSVYDALRLSQVMDRNTVSCTDANHFAACSEETLNEETWRNIWYKLWKRFKTTLSQFLYGNKRWGRNGKQLATPQHFLWSVREKQRRSIWRHNWTILQCQWKKWKQSIRFRIGDVFTTYRYTRLKILISDRYHHIHFFHE